MDHLYIRTDATPKMGIGHIMRCIAFAQAWQDRGGDVTFLSHCDSEALHQRIIDEDFDFIPIEKPHPEPYDLDYTLKILKQLKTQNSKLKTCLVLDGYHFTPDYQKTIRDSGYHLLVIDDYNHLPYYNTDILLNQNINAQDYKYSCDENTTQLLGCKYTLLRREFLKYKGWRREVPEKANKILVTMGGADPDNVTLKVINAMNLLDDSNLKVKIVIGPENPNLAIIKKALHQAQSFVQLLQRADMPELMRWADISISGGGSTCWELAFMQLPYLIIILSDNQERIAKGVGEARAALNCGWFDDLSENLLSNYIEQIIEDSITRKKYVKKGTELLDGLGVERVIDTMRKN